MDRSRINHLFKLHLEGKLTDMEALEWAVIVNDPLLDAELKAILDEYWHQARHDALDPHRAEEIFSIIVKPERKRSLIAWKRVAVAAMFLLIGSLGIYLLNQPADDSTSYTYTNDVNPGSNKAILTMANGHKISLTDAAIGNLADEAGVKITKTADGQLVYNFANVAGREMRYNTISTPAGGMYQVALPDGSRAWLNASSSLRFPVNFSGNTRKVTLTGEGYFEIAKDKKPFIVVTEIAGMAHEVQVLGTHFNINAYADESAYRATLLEGSIKLDDKHLLRPGEQAAGIGEAIRIAKVNTDNIVDWKAGDFVLKDVDFKSMMRKISRWYDVEVIYADEIGADQEVFGYISRSSKLSEVLRMIESAGGVRFKIEGRRVTVMK